MEIENQVKQNAADICEIRNECQKHRISTRDVLNEVLNIKSAVEKLKSDFTNLREVKQVVDSINAISIQQGSLSGQFAQKVPLTSEPIGNSSCNFAL